MRKKEIAIFVPAGGSDHGIEKYLSGNGFQVSRYQDDQILGREATGALVAVVIIAGSNFSKVAAQIMRRFIDIPVYACDPGRETAVLDASNAHGITVLDPSDQITDLSRRLGVSDRHSAQTLPRVLIVEDNAIDQEDIRNAIGDLADVDTAACSAEALRLLEGTDNLYAVVVTDLHLPKERETSRTDPENGLAVLEAVRRRSPATQSLMITRHFGDDDTYIHHHTALYRHGAVSFLSKEDVFEEPSILRREVEKAIADYEPIAATTMTELVITAITSLVGKTGEWVDLAAVGSAMRATQPDFDHKKHGFDKLSDLVKSLPDVECEQDHSHTPPGVMIRKKADRTPEGTPPQRQKAGEEYRSLFHFGFIFSPKLNDLANLALKEEWDDGSGEEKSILKHYLNHTFLRLQYEKKIFVSNDGDYAVFNSGLVDPIYQPIFAFFTRNKRVDARQPFFLTSFCRAGDAGDGQRIIRLFGRTPDPAEYFKDPADTVYNLSKGAPHVNWDHIIFDNIDRLPVQFIDRYAPKEFPVRDPETLDDEMAAHYKLSLQAAVRSDLQSLRDMTSRFQSAIDIAMRRVRWSFRTAVPSYYSSHNQISLLLPLSLVNDEKTDIVLVLEKTEEAYIAHTILTLRQAYYQARVASRPESEWLRP